MKRWPTSSRAREARHSWRPVGRGEGIGSSSHTLPPYLRHLAMREGNTHLNEATLHLRALGGRGMGCGVRGRAEGVASLLATQVLGLESNAPTVLRRDGDTRLHRQESRHSV